MKEDKRRNWHLNTRLNHPVETELHEGNKPLLQPVYNSAKFSPAEGIPLWDQYIYSRVSNPTVRQLELTLAELQEQEDCIVFASGIAALSTTFLSVLKSGEHMLTFRELYKPGRMFIKDYLKRFNISASVISMKDINQLESFITPSTRLIHFESPTNPNLEITDIDFLVKVARKHNLILSMDGTFAGLHQHHQFDIDIMIQSLTKFANGHGDVIAGAISGKKDIIASIRDMSLYLGASLDPQAAYLITRGLKTYQLRYNRQCETALKIAQFLSEQKAVRRVLYPGLESHPQHKLALKQMKDMGAVVSFELDAGSKLTAEKFCHRLKLIQFAASLGSTESIICPTNIFFGQDLSEDDRREMGINDYSLRLSVGLEEFVDLVDDLKAALNLTL